MTPTKKERIDLRKQEIGSKKERKREKHSEKFNRMFTFFFQIVRKGFIDFCGSDVNRDYNIILDPNGDDAKVSFKKYDNGEFNESFEIITKHPNLLKTLIIGKKSWGLTCKEWSLGIAEGTFTKKEILEEFNKLNIEVPQVYLIEFQNRIDKFRNDYKGLKDSFYFNSILSEYNKE